MTLCWLLDSPWASCTCCDNGPKVALARRPPAMPNEVSQALAQGQDTVSLNTCLPLLLRCLGNFGCHLSHFCAHPKLPWLPISAHPLLGCVSVLPRVASLLVAIGFSPAAVSHLYLLPLPQFGDVLGHVPMWRDTGSQRRQI